MSCANANFHRKNNPNEFLFSPKYAWVEVGSEAKRFKCRTGSLFPVSEYFKVALNSDFKEGHENTVKLRDVEVDTFKRFLKWIWDRPLGFLSDEEVRINKHGSLTDRTRLHEIYLTMYEFAERFMIPALATDAMELLHENLRNRVPSIRTVAMAFAILHEDSPMCRYLTYSYAGLYSWSSEPAMMHEIPGDVAECLPSVFFEKVPLDTRKRFRKSTWTLEGLCSIIGPQADDIGDDQNVWWMMKKYAKQGFSWERLSGLE